MSSFEHSVASWHVMAVTQFPLLRMSSRTGDLVWVRLTSTDWSLALICDDRFQLLTRHRFKVLLADGRLVGRPL